MSESIARLPARATAGVVADVVAPLLGRGVIARRPRVENVADRFDADRRAIRRLQAVRDEHGPGPVLLGLPARDVAFVLDPGHVRRVLDGTPEPFAAATREKRASLAHFQPGGVLISHGEERAPRRRFNEQVLETGCPVHTLGDALGAKVREEIAEMLAQARRRGELDWPAFATAWWRVVRRVTLGDGARDDDGITDVLTKLRGDANWSFARPRRDRLRESFATRLRAHLQRAEPGSLAERVAAVDGPQPDRQVPQWLFAFDAAGQATFRALALLREPTADRDLLRAAALESVRLWPTTPAILRETTTPTRWPNGTLPAGAMVVVFAPFLHRDDRRLPFADRFAPEVWLDGQAGDWPLVPFSAGPARCPGRELVLFCASEALATILGGASVALPRLAEPLPATLSPYRLRFAVGARRPPARAQPPSPAPTTPV